jgi:hypothetical protein
MGRSKMAGDSDMSPDRWIAFVKTKMTKITIQQASGSSVGDKPGLLLFTLCQTSEGLAAAQNKLFKITGGDSPAV